MDETLIIGIIILFTLFNKKSSTEKFTNKYNVKAKISETPNEIRKGLMFIKNKLPENHGMLFKMKRKSIHSFWMKNTYIPLDMIFINKDGKVIGFKKNRKPLSLKSSSIGKPSDYVLEMNGGWVDKVGLKEGDTILINEINKF